MGRPANPGRREATLQAATDYVVEQGLAGLSLRPLAAALGTSTRMLLYDFETKEKLISEILAEARRRESADWARYLEEADTSLAASLPVVWEWLTMPERRPYLRLFFEVYVDSIVRPDAYPDGGRSMVADWLGVISAAWGDDAVAATLVVATVRGLLLDRFSANDPERTDRAMSRFIELMSAGT